MEVAIVFMFLFAVIFGIFYLFYSTRNKERLALIEKGADATIFFSKKNDTKTAPFWKVLILNLSLLLMGVGAGLFLALILDALFSFNTDAIYPAMIFLVAGASLFIGFNITKKLDKDIN